MKCHTNTTRKFIFNANWFYKSKRQSHTSLSLVQKNRQQIESGCLTSNQTENMSWKCRILSKEQAVLLPYLAFNKGIDYCIIKTHPVNNGNCVLGPRWLSPSLELNCCPLDCRHVSTHIKVIRMKEAIANFLVVQNVSSQIYAEWTPP